MLKHFLGCFIRYTLPTMLITWIMYELLGYVGIALFMVGYIIYSCYIASKTKRR